MIFQAPHVSNPPFIKLFNHSILQASERPSLQACKGLGGIREAQTILNAHPNDVRKRRGLPSPHLSHQPPNDAELPPATTLHNPCKTMEATFSALGTLLECSWTLLGPPSRVNLPLSALNFTLISQLSVNIGPNLPPKLIFSSITVLPNLDFCNTLQCFSRFLNNSTNRFQHAIQAPT